MKRFLLVLLLVATASAQQPWEGPVEKLDYPALEKLVQSDRGQAQGWFDQLLQHDPATHQLVLNWLAHALGPQAEARLKEKGLLVVVSWEDPVKGGRSVDRHIRYDAALRRVDEQLDVGAYQEARQSMQTVMDSRPFDDPDLLVEIVVRNFILQDRTESNDYVPRSAETLRGVLAGTDPTGASVDSVVTAASSLGRLSRRSDRPLEARKTYEVLLKKAALRDSPTTRAARLLAVTYLAQDRYQREGYPAPAAFQGELQKWLEEVDFAHLSRAYRPALADALVAWAEMARQAGSEPSLDLLQRKLVEWEKQGVRQATFARLRVALLRAKDPNEVAALYDQAVKTLPDTSQEALRFLLQLREAQARAAAARGLDGYPVVVSCCRDAVSIAEELSLTRDRIDVLNEFTPYLRKMPIYESFESENQWALQESERRGYRRGTLQALINQGDYQLELGNQAESLRSYEQAVAVFEQWVGELGAGAQQREELRRPIERVYRRIADLKLSAGQGQEAFLALVRQQQAELMLGLDPMRVEPLQKALRAQEDARKQADELALLQAQPNANPVEVAEKSRLVASSKAEFFTTVRDLRQSGKNYDGMLAIQPVEFAQLQQNLPEGALLVQYYPTETKLYLFLVSRQDFKIREVDLGRAELDKLVVETRRELLRPTREAVDWNGAQALGKSLERLYAILIEPASEEVEKATTLAVVPTGQLLYVPFPALYHKQRFLVQDKPVVTLLRAADLARLSRPVERGQRLLALGNPDGSLAGAEAEVRSLGGLFPASEVFVGGQADRDKLSHPADFIHLATHADLDSLSPNDSYLVLGGGRRLAVSDIFELPLGKTRLVTLSACQTEVGERQPGAALSSLAEAFWVAGSPTLVASLWKVEDNATREEMVQFYSGLKDGQDLARSMQQAQISMIGKPATAHPFYWAAFTVIGDWR